MKRLFAFFLVLFTFLQGSVVFAQTPTELQAEIQQLMQTIQSLQTQVQNRTTPAPQNTNCSPLILTSKIYLGIRDAQTKGEVTKLQTFLKAQGDYTYPEITGYFGPVTQQAVQKFQARTNIVRSGTPATTGYGSVGNLTKAKIRELSCVAGNTITPLPPTSVTPGEFPSGNSPASCFVPTTQLRLGNRSQDVRQLQVFLWQQGDFQIQEFTDFFGPLTERAVRSFQRRNNLEQVGSIGPLTLSKIKAIKCTTEPTIGGGEFPGGNSGSVVTTPPVSTTPVVIGGEFPGGNSGVAQGGATNTSGAAGSGGGSVSIVGASGSGGGSGASGQGSGGIQNQVDATAPTITTIQASNITTTGAVITWTTNEPAESEVNYGLTTSYSNPPILHTSRTTSHSVTLSGLTANSVYHYRVISKDSTGNQRTSGDFTFTTAAVVVLDTTAPVITNIQSIPTSNGATITWNTNEASDTQVDYGLTTSYGSSSTLVATALTLHSVTLTGLQPSI